MPDTGFYRHPFYDHHGYNYNATLAPDATSVQHDEFGHGTAEAANIFAIAGVSALLKQAQPGLSPDLVKAILKASARDVLDGKSAMGEVATDGYDGPTGSGLVNAEAAYRLARSVTPRNLHTLPPPR